jgi:hypothetical protein
VVPVYIVIVPDTTRLSVFLHHEGNFVNQLKEIAELSELIEKIHTIAWFV